MDYGKPLKNPLNKEFRMKLNKSDLKNKAMWEEKGFELPQYDIEKILKIIH